MHRRRFLAAAGLATVGLAGCASRSETPANGTPTTTPPQTLSVTAELESLQPAVVTLGTDSLGIEHDAGRQYLYLDVTAEAGQGPSREDLRVRFDGDAHGPATVDRLWRAVPEDDGRYDRPSGEGWVLFDLPATGDAADVALVDAERGGEWPIAAQASVDLDGRLATAAPPLSLEVDGPTTMALGDQPALALTVTNDGDRDGTFVAALNRRGPLIAYSPVRAISRVVPPGDQTTIEVTDERSLDRPPEDDLGDGRPDMHYTLQWTGAQRSHDVRLVETEDG